MNRQGNVIIPENLSDAEIETRLTDAAVKIKRLRVPMVIFIITAVFALFSSAVTYDPVVPFVIMLISIIAAGISFATLSNARRVIKELVRNNIVKGVLSEEFELISYDPWGHIDIGTINAVSLFDRWNRCAGSDYIRGRYKGVNFTFSDLHLEHVVKRKKQTVRVTRFKGQWLICESRRALPHSIHLREREQLADRKRMKSNVETENSEFNNKYQIITADPHTLFYVLTPHFMEYILNMDNRADARTYMCFLGDKVHITLHNGRDLFEANERMALRGISLDQIRDSIRWDVKYITSVIDELLLNDRLF